MRRVLGTILLVVFALRSLVPAGFMLGGSQDGAHGGGLKVVICPHHAGMVKADLAKLPSAPKPAKSSNEICPYAGSAVKAGAAGEPIILASAVRYAAVHYARTVALFAETPRPSATSARGPPSKLG